MLQEPNHCGEEFGWDDEIEDDLVENLVVKTLAQFALPAAATTSLVGVPIYIYLVGALQFHFMLYLLDYFIIRRLSEL